MAYSVETEAVAMDGASIDVFFKVLVSYVLEGLHFISSWTKLRLKRVTACFVL